MPFTILHCDQLSKCFAGKKEPNLRPALHELSFSLHKREIVGLVGPDGAGKTTLLRLIAGLLKPSSGNIELPGDSAADERQSFIGYMPQQFGLYQDLTVQENLDFHADLQELAQAERAQRFAELLQLTDLAPFVKRRAGQLSGGMKQKLGLACALVKSPPLLLLDEPTVGVDPVSRRDLWRIIERLVQEQEATVLVATSYLDEAEHCQRVMVLYDGELIASGPPQEFSSQLRERVFRLTPRGELSPRQLQGELSSRDGIIDTTIRSGQVHCVLNAESHGTELFADLQQAQVESWPPSFEDAFMTLIPRHSAVTVTTAGSGDIQAGIPNTATEVMVKATGLKKVFGSFEAVKGIDFSVKRGEIFGLLGPNGAGKSTTFRMLCGLSAVSDGEASVAGHDLRRARARARAHLGYVAQIFSLYRQLSVGANLEFYGKAYGLHGARLRQRLDWALEEFDLGARRNLAAGSLPGGYRQRLAMAVAMLHEPEILFLDEPTSGADPLARREFWLRINGFARQGVTVIVTTHFMEEAEFCDRMLIMSHGSELAQGTPQEIRRLVQTPDNPNPSIEDAFIALAEGGKERTGTQP